MKGPQPLPELLAPAGSVRALEAAVAAGADAVYLGGRQFGARKNASNFDDEGITNAIDFSHLYGVKVYITVNTLVHDAEMDKALTHIAHLHAAGADAVLVQDLGLAMQARICFPDLPLHASTQMGICDAQGVRWAAQEGFSRVVMARETPISEIIPLARMAAPLGAGIEVFVHGALCYAYSGQCLLSSSIGGRSGNRGVCAQPCRKPYRFLCTISDIYGRPSRIQSAPGEERVLLSPRDLATYRHLDKVARSGVAALKIEGRMRSPEYVFTVVSIYRRALDAIAAGRFEPSLRDEEALALAFNREFTGGYLLGGGPCMVMGRSCAGNRGLLLGSVPAPDKRGRPGIISFTGQIMPGPHDGIVIIDPDGHVLVGGPVHQVLEVGSWGLTIRDGIAVPPGSKVYLTAKAGWEKEVQHQIRSAMASRPATFTLNLQVSLSPEEPAVITGTVSTQGRTVAPVSMRSDNSFPRATTQATTGGEVRKHCTRTGGTPFTVDQCRVVYEGGLFIRPAELNALRRSLVQEAASVLVGTWRRPPSPQWNTAGFASAHSPQQAEKEGAAHPDEWEPKICVLVSDCTAIPGLVAEGCTCIYFEPVPPDQEVYCQRTQGRGSHPGLPLAVQVNLLREALTYCTAYPIECHWKWPHIPGPAFLQEALPHIGDLVTSGLSGVMVEGHGYGEALLAACPSLFLTGYHGLNTYNHETAWHLARTFDRVFLSPELTLHEIRALTRGGRDGGLDLSFYLQVQGNLEVVVSRDLLPMLVGDREGGILGDGRVCGLIDERARFFPVHIDSGCRTVIGNAVETCLLDHLPSLAAVGIDAIVIDARWRPPNYAAAMTALYRDAVMVVQKRGLEASDNLIALREYARAISWGGITTGHFRRGRNEEEI